MTNPVNCDHPKGQQRHLNFKGHLSLQNHMLLPTMAELSVNICKLYKIYMITGHTIQKLYDYWSYDIKDILVMCVFL